MDVIDKEKRLREKRVIAREHPYLDVDYLCRDEIKDRDYAVDCLIDAIRERLSQA